MTHRPLRNRQRRRKPHTVSGGRRSASPVINRGRLWYDALTGEQLSELKTWYRAWLDGTNTQTIPEKPEWLT